MPHSDWRYVTAQATKRPAPLGTDAILPQMQGKGLMTKLRDTSVRFESVSMAFSRGEGQAGGR